MPTSLPTAVPVSSVTGSSAIGLILVGPTLAQLESDESRDRDVLPGGRDDFLDHLAHPAALGAFVPQPGLVVQAKLLVELAPATLDYLVEPLLCLALQ